MKAAQVTKYTKNDLALTLSEIPRPKVSTNEVLLKVRTAGVNPLDNMITKGEVKLITPYKLPLVAGNEVVGTVVFCGAEVTEFAVGDRVFGRLPLERIGAFAEYVAVRSDALAKVPAYLSDEQAAAIPLTALTVMEAFALMDVKANKTLFISGGTGSLGAMAIPLAKAYGLKVITSGSLANKDRVLKLGIDRFLDYKTEDYAKELTQVDYVLDTLGGKETEKQLKILKKGGHLVSLKGLPNGAFAQRMGFSKPKKLLFTLAGRKLDRLAKNLGVNYDFVFVRSNGQNLSKAAVIFEKQQLQPAVDEVYALEEIDLALKKVAHGHSRGKTVIKVAQGTGKDGLFNDD